MNTQTLISPQVVALQLPVALEEGALHLLSQYNPNVELWQEDDKLLIAERDFCFDQVGFFTLRLSPALEVKDEWLEELSSQSNFKIETNADGTIIIHMLTTGIIATFTLLIGTVIVLWNREHKDGRVHGESAGYLLPDPSSEEGEMMRRAPDVSYIAYEKASKERQNTWKYREVAPTLCIEVVSAKADTRKELRKMMRDWMGTGTEIGLVVDPHAELFYLFEQGKETFERCTFAQIFAHQALQGLSIDFATLLAEAREEEGG